MTSVAGTSGRTRSQRTQTLAPGSAAGNEAEASVNASVAAPRDEERVLPLPGWLRRLYFIFPIVLYIPDAIFNFYVYSDGVQPPNNANPLMQAAFLALWGFVAVGVVGMAYLLSVLAPWHWGQNHRVQAFFCGLGVLIATAITTWNSLAYRSLNFKEFNTDQWVYQIWPQLKAANVSITMILVAVAPPFWGLFWAIVQPTENRRHNIAELQESHAERLVRIQQEAEIKRLRAETNAKIREAQLRGLAQSASAARAQAAEVFQRRKGETGEVPAVGAQNADSANAAKDGNATAGATDAQTDEENGASKLVPFHSLAPSRENPSRPVFMNSVAPSSTPDVYTAPARGQRPTVAAQPAMWDAQGSAGMPTSDVLNPPTLGNTLGNAFDDDADESTGTSGVHRALRRPNQVSPLMHSLNRPHREVVQAIDDLVQELKPEYRGGKIPQTRMVSGLVEKLGISESEARKALQSYKEQAQIQRSGNTPRR